ncbi:MAG: carboxylating nicotinate-nucleotide diphosphorylase [Chloroflexi bacterium]|nr:carboxylating nicotinate-nucleotide diphosphorylase [Chloroflexota bacterium]
MAEERVSPPDPSLVERIVEAALEEDAARNDVTTSALIAPDQRGSATVIAREAGVIAGLPVAAAVFTALDASLQFEPLVPEGAAVGPDAGVARVAGSLAPILSGERVALNFLQRLSGIATATRQLVDAVAGLSVRIVDTRKTTPGLRALERYAVRAGGGQNHRFNLSDAVLIKDNHLAAARNGGLSIAQVVQRARGTGPHTMRIEIEAATVAEAMQALEAGADIVLLDNMSEEEMRQVVAATNGRAVIEASGGVTLQNVRAIAETGVDLISVGAITHSAPALDLSLELDG